MAKHKLTMLKPQIAVLGERTARTPAAAGDRRWEGKQRGKTTTESGYGWAWQKLVKLIRQRDCDVCQECLRTKHLPIGTYSAVDHIVPRDEGGTDDPSNLEVICKDHHATKTAHEGLRRSGGFC